MAGNNEQEQTGGRTFRLLHRHFFRPIILLARRKRLSFQAEDLQTMTDALVSLLEAQPSLNDQIPNLGHIPRVIDAMRTEDETKAKLCLTVMHPLSVSEVRWSHL